MRNKAATKVTETSNARDGFRFWPLHTATFKKSRLHHRGKPGRFGLSTLAGYAAQVSRTHSPLAPKSGESVHMNESIQRACCTQIRDVWNFSFVMLVLLDISRDTSRRLGTRTLWNLYCALEMRQRPFRNFMGIKLSRDIGEVNWRCQNCSSV